MKDIDQAALPRILRGKTGNTEEEKTAGKARWTAANSITMLRMAGTLALLFLRGPKSPLPRPEQKMHPRVPSVPSRFGQVKPPSSASL